MLMSDSKRSHVLSLITSKNDNSAERDVMGACGEKQNLFSI